MTDTKENKSLEALDRIYDNAIYEDWNSGELYTQQQYQDDKHIVRQTLQSQAEKDRVMDLMAQALKFYTGKSINNHNYHALMDTDLTAKAIESLSEYEKIKGYS